MVTDHTPIWGLCPDKRRNGDWCLKDYFWQNTASASKNRCLVLWLCRMSVLFGKKFKLPNVKEQQRICSPKQVTAWWLQRSSQLWEGKEGPFCVFCVICMPWLLTLVCSLSHCFNCIIFVILIEFVWFREINFFQIEELFLFSGWGKRVCFFFLF